LPHQEELLKERTGFQHGETGNEFTLPPEATKNQTKDKIYVF
jgi:hypothetical protein